MTVNKAARLNSLRIAFRPAAVGFVYNVVTIAVKVQTWVRMYDRCFKLHFDDGWQGGVVGFVMRYNVGHVISSFVNEFVRIALTLVLFRTSRLKLQKKIANNITLHCKDLQVRYGGEVSKGALEKHTKLSFLILYCNNPRWGTPPPVGLPPWPGPTRAGVPEVGYPPSQVRQGGPQGGFPPWQGYPPAGPGWGTTPPPLDLAGVPPPPRSVDRQMDGWMDRHVWKHYLPVVLRTRSVIRTRNWIAQWEIFCTNLDHLIRENVRQGRTKTCISQFRHPDTINEIWGSS